MKKILAILCAILCLMSCFVLPSSAADATIGIPVSPVLTSNMYAGSLAYIDTDYDVQLTSEVAVNNSSYPLYFSHGMFGEIAIDDVYAGTGALFFSVDFDSDTYSSYSSEEYNLRVSWATYSQGKTYTYTDTQYYAAATDLTFINTIVKVPMMFGISEHDSTPLSTYGVYDEQYNWNRYGYYDEYLFTGDIVDTILSGSNCKMCVPLWLDCTDLVLEFSMTLEPVSSSETPAVTTSVTTTSSTDPVEPTDFDMTSFVEPDLYDYLIDFTVDGLFGSGAGIVTSGLDVTDFYTLNNTYRIRDYTDKFTLVEWSLMYDKIYTAVFSSAYADGVTDDDFVNSSFEQYIIDLPCSIKAHDSIPDTSQLGFRMEMYFALSRDTAGKFTKAFYNAIDVDSNFNFYGFETFSLNVNNLLIPSEYFTVEVNSSGQYMRVSLELDGKNETHRKFMDSILDCDGTAQISFVVDDYLCNSFQVGITQAGFWKKYDTAIGGLTQDDLDNAYNKGYNQGISDGSDKNYVFGFVNGMWSGFSNFYTIVTNGISIGGITLNAIITSLVIIAVLAIVIKKVT